VARERDRGGGVDMSKYDADEWEEVTDYGWRLDTRRVFEDIDARLTALEQQPGGKQETNPAPNETSKTLFVNYKQEIHNEDGTLRSVSYPFKPATRAQVEAEARRLGLLYTTPKQKVAEKFLEAALDNLNGGEDSYEDTARAFIRESKREGAIHGEWLEGMAAVLEAAHSDQAKGGEGWAN
jgi:hypothetical protein